MGDSHENVKLNVRVSPSKKQEWQAALDDDETLSGLVRTAVDREISNEYVPVEAIENLPENTPTDIDLSEVTDQLSALQRSIESIHGKVESLATVEEAEEDIEELAIELTDRLPSYPNDIPKDAIPLRSSEGGKRDYIEYLIEARKHDKHFHIDGSAQRLANELREPETKIRQALLSLEHETTESITSAIVDGQRHWVNI